MIKFIRNLLTATTDRDDQEKVKNAIAFFASEHERLTQKPLPVNSVHKYLALLDQASFEKVGRPVFGRHCRRAGREFTKPWGEQEARNGDCFVVMLTEGEYVVNATKSLNLSYFSSLELDEMKRLVKVNALREVLQTKFSSLDTDDTKINADFLDDSSEETTEIGDNVVDASDSSSFTKHKEVDQMTGLNMLIEKYETRLNELEARMAEVKRKLETVTEALRLLKDEGLLEDEPKPWP